MLKHQLQVFDPPLCCPTGICGPDPDPSLARFAADLLWAESHGVQVERFSLAREPGRFAGTPLVSEALRRRSLAALPLVLWDSEVLSEGAYPSRLALEVRMGASTSEASPKRLRIVVGSCCAPGSGCCG